VPAYRTFRLPRKRLQVLGADLNRSERPSPLGPQHARRANRASRSEMNSSWNVHPQDHDKEKQRGIQRHRLGIRNPVLRPTVPLVHGAPLSIPRRVTSALNLPHQDGLVVGAGLNCSESCKAEEESVRDPLRLFFGPSLVRRRRQPSANECSARLVCFSFFAELSHRSTPQRPTLPSRVAGQSPDSAMVKRYEECPLLSRAFSDRSVVAIVVVAGPDSLPAPRRRLPTPA